MINLTMDFDNDYYFDDDYVDTYNIVMDVIAEDYDIWESEYFEDSIYND